MSRTPDGYQPMPPFAPVFHGTATVNDKGQVVIPAEARKALEIAGGDKLLVFQMGGSLMLSPAPEMEKFAAMLAGRLDMVRAAMGQLGLDAESLDDAAAKPARGGKRGGKGRTAHDDGHQPGDGAGD